MSLISLLASIFALPNRSRGLQPVMPAPPLPIPLLLLFLWLLTAPHKHILANYAFDVALKNLQQTDESTIEWDIFLRKAPGSNDFSLYMMQVSLEFNNDILNVGNFEEIDFGFVRIGPEVNQNSLFFIDNDCTISGSEPNMQLHWAVSFPPGKGQNMTLVSDDWLKVARFRARLSKEGAAHHFSCNDLQLGFQSADKQVIVRRALNTSDTYDGEGCVDVTLNNTIPEPGSHLPVAALAGYVFSGSGCWNDPQQWNLVTASQPNSMPPNHNHNALVTGQATINTTIELNQVTIAALNAELPTVQTGELNVEHWGLGFFSVENNIITSDGGLYIIDHGIIVGNNFGLTLNNYRLSYTGNIFNDIFNILQGHGHGVSEGDYFRAYATSDLGTAYGQAYRVSDLAEGAAPVGGVVSVPGRLTIAAGAGLSVDVLHNEPGAGSLLLESTPQGSATLIHGNEGVEATVQQYIPASVPFSDKSTAPDTWYWLSPPVQGQRIDDFLAERGDAFDLYRWDESSDLWRNYKGSAFGQTCFVVGEGYLFAAPVEDTYVYRGTLPVGRQSWEELGRRHNAGEHGPGWHLIGNPYASALLFDDTYWQSETVAYTPQYWVEEQGSYHAYLQGEAIPPATAFFVEALEENASMAIEDGVRRHNHHNDKQKLLPTNGACGNYIILSARPLDDSILNAVSCVDDPEDLVALPNKGSRRQLAYIRLVSQRNGDFDNRYMSRFRQGDAPTFCSLRNGEMLLVNAITQSEPSQRIPLFFQKCSDSQIYSITLEQTTGNMPLYLIDHKRNKALPLKTGGRYVFRASAYDDARRFELAFEKPCVITSKRDELPQSSHINSETKVRAWSHGRKLYLMNPGEGTSVKLFDTSGQKLRRFFAPPGKSTHSTSLPAGLYLLQTINGRYKQTKKILLLPLDATF